MKLKVKISVIFSSLMLLTGYFVFSAFEAAPLPMATESCSMANTAFKAGEKLVYKMYYNWGIIWVPAGEVNFEVTESKDHYEIKAVGQTYKSYENIFKVNDYFYTRVDKKTLLPAGFVRRVEEGNYRAYDSIYFDQARNMAISFNGKTKESTKSQVFRFDDCMQDLISNIYFLRNMDTKVFSGNAKLEIKLFFDKEVYPVSMRYEGKENKEIKQLGHFKTLKIVPDLIAGNVFKKGDNMTLWVSDDNNHIPLMIESPVSVGSVKAVLKSYSGLKHGLDSEIKE
jgi:hypothetical protein